MSVLQELVQDIPVPKMVKVKQAFDDTKVEDVEATLQEELQKVKDRIKPGAKIAVAVGSRGIDALPEMTRLRKLSSCIIFFVVFCFRVQRYEVFLHCAIPIYMENEGLAGSEEREVREVREIRVS